MSYALKDRYNEAFYKELGEVLADIIPDLKWEKFTENIFSDGWIDRELKDRMKHTSNCFVSILAHDFPTASLQIVELVRQLEKRCVIGKSLEYMFLPDYIEHYGIDFLAESVRTFEEITAFTSCEFAVRPFIIRYPDQMLKQMVSWTQSKNLHVRRLASEGCRPRLPWAIGLPKYKEDPTAVIPVLENLMNDPSEYVRRSVANNLNDISKDHPTVVMKFVNRWKGKSIAIDKLLKHGCRTLLKAGLPEVLTIFGYHRDRFLMENFQVLSPSVSTDQNLAFSATVRNGSAEKSVLRLEYAIYYLRKAGSHSKKVFKISETAMDAGVEKTLMKQQSFRAITTRKFYAGEHFVSLIINGLESDLRSFKLVL